MDSGIGERLREARASRALELDQAAERLKIRKRYLRALEEERWDVLPGEAYVRGFLHSYAELLGLDADALVAEYRLAHEAQAAEAEEEAAERAEAAEETEAEATVMPPAPPIRPGLSAQAWRGRRPGRVAIAAAAAIAALGVGAVLVLALTGGPDDEGRGATERPGSAPAREGDAGKPTRKAPPRATLRFTTTAPVWVCLVDHRGRPVIDGVTLPEGERQGPFRAKRFDLTLGNGQVELRANGEPVQIAAPAEPVGYRITPERTRELSESQRPTCE